MKFNELLLFTFAIFRRCLDPEMKDATCEGVSLETEREENEAVTDEEEELFWSKRLLGCRTANPLINTVYYYNGKILGLWGSDHRSLKNFELGANFIKCEENFCLNMFKRESNLFVTMSGKTQSVFVRRISNVYWSRKVQSQGK